jgi:hypothetical protein
MVKAWVTEKNTLKPLPMWMDVKYEPGTVKLWLLMIMVKLLLKRSAYCWQALPNSFRCGQKNNHC